MKEFKNLKIAVAGTGYVGLSLAVLLAQHHQVTAVDIVPEKVELINSKKSPIQDEYIEKYLAEKELNLTATLDAKNVWWSWSANYVPPKIPPLRFQCPMKYSASGFFPMALCCEKFDVLHGKAVNTLHQRFSRNIIFTATTLDLKHILSINDTAIPDPQPLWGADFMFSVAHLLTASFVLV